MTDLPTKVERVRAYVVIAGGEAEHGSPGPVPAYDTELDRKVLLHDLGPIEAPETESRLDRARRWSAVSHPNLATVHDVFTELGRAWVVVEHVRGETLTAWCEGGARSASQVRAALSGITGAVREVRRAGLVHGTLAAETVVLDGAGHGHLVGLSFEPISDPSAGADIRALAGLVRWVFGATGVRVTRRLVAALAACEVPAPTPEALRRLEAELARDPRRRARLVAAASAAVVVGAAALLVPGAVLRERQEMCAMADQLGRELWNESTEARIAATFRALNLPYGAYAASRASQALSARVDAWARMRSEACRETHVHGRRSPEVLDRQAQCLDERLEEMATVVSLLETADTDVAARALDMVDGLPGLERCAPQEVSAGPVDPPESSRGAVDELRKRLARLRALELAGRSRDALGEAENLAVEARALGYEPLVAEAVHRHGSLLTVGTEPAAAVPVLEEAVRWAWVAGHDAVAARSWVSLQQVVGETLGQVAGSDEAWEMGRAAWVRAGEPPEEHADLVAARAVVMFARGRYDECAELHREALALRRELHPEDHPAVVSSRHDLANALSVGGKPEEALEMYEEVLASWSRTLGPSHPRIANVHNNMAAAHIARDELAEADANLRKTLEIRMAVHGPEHLQVANVLENLGVVAFRLGKHDEAMERFRASLRIKQATLPPNAPSVAGPWINLGTVLQARGEWDAAREHYEKAREIYESGAGVDHPNVAIALHNIGGTLRESGDAAAAVPYLERALAIREKTFGREHSTVGSTLTELGQALVDLKDVPRGREVLERAVALWASLPETTDPRAATARFALAEVLVSSPPDRERALDLARLALAAHREARPPRKKEAAAVARFLERHRGGRD